jgi:beta-phosphoglucomutase
MTSPINPQMILLDLDGTLADSLSVMRNAYRLFLKQFQRKATNAEFESLNGPSFVEIVRRLKRSHALKEDENILLSYYFDILDDAYANVKPSKGAVEFLQKARENCCTVGIVTSNTKKITQFWLETVRLAHMIDFIVSGDEVTRSKPHSEPYVIASKKASCNPDQIVAIEDSLQGVQSAMGAGLKTLVIIQPEQTQFFWPEGVEPLSSLLEASEKLFAAINEVRQSETGALNDFTEACKDEI